MSCCDNKTNKKVKDWSEKDDNKENSFKFNKISLIFAIGIIGFAVFRFIL